LSGRSAGSGQQPIPVSLSRRPISDMAASDRSSRIEQAIGRAPDPGRASVQDMGVDLGGRDVPVPQQFLNGPDVVPILQQVRGEGIGQVNEGRLLVLLEDG